MKTATLDILRCPFCGGRVELVTSLFHQVDGDEIRDGILGCQCCIFGVLEGIPIMQLNDQTNAARAHIEAGRLDLARQTMFNLDDEAHAARFDRVVASPTSTYRDVVGALGPNFEGGYFLYRFSDPTYIVADAVVRAVAGTTLKTGGRAIDICGGSGHLTRSLVDLSPSPVLADLYFSKIWLARRFTAPGCEGVCCDGNSPFPFARGAFRYAMCTDAFMYIWTKRLFVGEMARLVDGQPGASLVIGHTHNERTWTPSHGQPLTQEGYRNLFETYTPRIFGESRLFEDVVSGGPLDLSRVDPAELIDAEQALTIVASSNPEVLTAHPLNARAEVRGELRLNPLYTQTTAGDRIALRLAFPSEDYEQEYGACRRYLPEDVTLDRTSVDALQTGHLPDAVADLVRRRVVLDLPKHYY